MIDPNETGQSGHERDKNIPKIGTPLAHASSRYELIDKDGLWIGSYEKAFIAANVARRLWPDQEQDEDRTGKGWDVQVADAAR